MGSRASIPLESLRAPRSSPETLGWTTSGLKERDSEVQKVVSIFDAVEHLRDIRSKTRVTAPKMLNPAEGIPHAGCGAWRRSGSSSPEGAADCSPRRKPWENG